MDSARARDLAPLGPELHRCADRGVRCLSFDLFLITAPRINKFHHSSTPSRSLFMCSS